MTHISPLLVALIAIVGLSIIGLPVAYAMIGGSILWLLVSGLDMGTAAEQLLNGMMTSQLLLAIPLFILAAEFMNTGSIMDRLLHFCNAIVGRFRGGLAQVNVLQSVVFASMSGSALADAAASGKLMQTLMTKDGKYPPAFAAALTCVSSVIGPIIPPSIPLVLYALISDTSVWFLFVGGLVPGLLLGAVQSGLVAAVAKRRNFPVEKPVPLREIPRVTWEALPALLMPVILLGCLYSGISTPTEAAAIAAAYALLVSALLYRSVRWKDVYRSLVTSARITVSIGMLIAGALVFNYVITAENIPKTLSAILKTYELSPLMFLLAVNVMLLILGCFLEGTTIILVILPVLLPTAQALGIDMVHFGVMAVVNIMIGLVTPPYGLLLFMMTKIADVPLRDMVREVMPFLYVMIGALAIIMLVPDTVLFLPRLLGLQGLMESLPMTDRYALFGQPLGHSKSPLIHAEFARQTAQDLTYEAIEAPIGGFADAVDRFRAAGGRGCNVTQPFKLDAFAYSTEQTERARRAGAVNCMKFEGDRVMAENFDGLALIRDIERNLGYPIRGRRVLLLGAGGAARGAILPFLEQEPEVLDIENRTVSKAKALGDQFATQRNFGTGGFSDFAGQRFDIVVNATSASLRGELPQVSPTAFAKGCLAYDMVYGKGLTPFLRLARDAGAGRLADGIGMLIEQAAEAFLWWRGVRPATAALIEKLSVPLA